MLPLGLWLSNIMASASTPLETTSQKVVCSSLVCVMSFAIDGILNFVSVELT